MCNQRRDAAWQLSQIGMRYTCLEEVLLNILEETAKYKLCFLRYGYDFTHLLCLSPIISIGPLTRLRLILNFPIFCKKRASLERLIIVFENSLPKGFFLVK